jgi:hypothetical protein
MQGSMDMSTIEANRANAVDQSKAGILSTDATRRGRLNQAEASRTGNAMSGLLIGSSGAQGYLSGSQVANSMGKK